MLTVLQNAPAGTPWIVALVAVIGVLATMVKAWAVLRKVEIEGRVGERKVEVEADTALSPALMERIGNLEAKLELERASCDERIDRLEARHTEAVKKMEAEVRVLRHDRNNVRQALNMMFVLLRREGANVGEVVAEIEDMLKRGDEVIALEKGAMTR